MNTSVYFSIPVLDENDYLFTTLDCIADQTFKGKICVYLCVNQPDSWWKNDKSVVCFRNQLTLFRLQNGYRNLNIHVIDKTSQGNGWSEKKKGVGIARKTIVNNILQQASESDILISMDADTTFNECFVETIVETLQSNPKAVALNIPYYHSLCGNDIQDRALLRYEIYLRSYMLNMLRIDSPYAFTAFGSAIACRIKDYKAIGGFDGQTAGEDFYFLQKMVKYGKLKLYTDTHVYPSSRISERVLYGTGTAIADFQNNNFNRYPIFHFSSFDVIAETYQRIHEIFNKDIVSEFIEFMNYNSIDQDLWGKLRTNYKTLPLFTKAFHQKIDGLRLFQFIRNRQLSIHKTDEICLQDYLTAFYPIKFFDMDPISFDISTIDKLQSIRNFLANEEDSMRKKQDFRIFEKKRVILPNEI